METNGGGARPRFRPLRIVVPVLLALLAVSAWAQWYARAVSLPRYCDREEATMERLRRILDQTRPAGDGPTRPYVIAAKLLFLVPREANEPTGSYLARVRRRLQRDCG